MFKSYHTANDHTLPGQLKFTSDTSREFVLPSSLLLPLTGADMGVRRESKLPGP